MTDPLRFPSRSFTTGVSAMRSPTFIALTGLFVAAIVAALAVGVTEAGAPPDQTVGAPLNPNVGCHGRDRDPIVLCVGVTGSMGSSGVQGPAASGCHGEKAPAGCHGRKSSVGQRHAARVGARADRREAARTARQDARADRAASRSCHGSGGTGNALPAAQTEGSPQLSPCDCPPDGCACRR